MTEEIINNETNGTDTEEMSDKGLLNGIDTGNEETQKTIENFIPEGFDADIYDTETQSLKMDAVKDRLNANKVEIEKYKKQALDMRKKLSKGVELPKTQDEYGTTQFDDKYLPYFEDKESIVGKHVNESMAFLDKLAFENGLTLEQSNVYKNALLKYMEDVHILDTRTDDEKAEERKQYLSEQRKILGDRASDIISENYDFYKTRGGYAPDVRDWVMSQIKESAVANKFFEQNRMLLFGHTSYDIPQYTNSQDSPDALKTEFMNKDTSEQRREQILKECMAKGIKLF